MGEDWGGLLDALGDLIGAFANADPALWLFALASAATVLFLLWVAYVTG